MSLKPLNTRLFGGRGESQPQGGGARRALATRGDAAEVAQGEVEHLQKEEERVRYPISNPSQPGCIVPVQRVVGF